MIGMIQSKLENITSNLDHRGTSSMIIAHKRVTDARESILKGSK